MLAIARYRFWISKVRKTLSFISKKFAKIFARKIKKNLFKLLLSLLNQYGREKNVGSQFRSVVEKIRIPSVKYIAFDFHRHCQSLNWKRLSYLKEEIMPDIRQFG